VIVELPTIAVTGSTGFVGGEVAAQLTSAGVPLRLLTRSAAPALPDTVEFTVDYADAAAAEEALTGVHTLFMVSGRESATRRDEHATFIDAAAAAGVGHIVYTSFQGAAPDATFTLGRDHYATERHIENSGMGYTFLRDSFYSDFLPLMAGDDGVIRGPAGSGRVAAVCREDVARVAATVLREPALHRNATYTLTGPEAISLEEAAAMIAVAHGSGVRFHNESIDEAYASRERYHAPVWQVDAWVSTYTSIALGEVAEVTDDVERVTGRRAMTLNEFLNR
jgi:NAD(P)H dehydrogenase (quinone)